MTDDQTPATPAPQNWAWTVDKAGPDVDPERARMSTGHADFAPGSTPGEVADGVAMTCRMNHSYYRGPLDVAVWPLSDLDDMARWPRRDHRRPADAEHFRYEELAADADPQSTAVRWFSEVVPGLPTGEAHPGRWIRDPQSQGVDLVDDDPRDAESSPYLDVFGTGTADDPFRFRTVGRD